VDERRRVQLSKRMSYLLRHHPEDGGVGPDERGFVPIDALAEAVGATRQQILEVAERDPKGRFEISEDGEMIRAAYGHSFDLEQPGELCEPPATLYHGTPRRSVDSILREGLRPMGRQMVHLSATVEDARTVGLRRDEHPIVLAIDAAGAAEAGVCFYHAGEVYLADRIPPEFINVAKEL
jgi:putative RNA 2'-phosphotransferase